MFAITALEIVSSIIVAAPVSSIYDDHTFVLRVAPNASEFRGQVCAEIRCPGSMKAKQPLRELGIRYTQLETWVHPQLGWKLLRFTASPADLLKLHEACLSPNLPAIDDETQRHLCEFVTAPTADLSAKGVRELRKLAQDLGIKGAAKLKKADLIAAISN